MPIQARRAGRLRIERIPNLLLARKRTLPSPGTILYRTMALDENTHDLVGQQHPLAGQLQPIFLVYEQPGLDERD